RVVDQTRRVDARRSRRYWVGRDVPGPRRVGTLKGLEQADELLEVRGLLVEPALALRGNLGQDPAHGEPVGLSLLVQFTTDEDALRGVPTLLGDIDGQPVAYLVEGNQVAVRQMPRLPPGLRLHLEDKRGRV